MRLKILATTVVHFLRLAINQARRANSLMNRVRDQTARFPSLSPSRGSEKSTLIPNALRKKTSTN